MADRSRDAYPLAALIEVRAREEHDCKSALADAVREAADARAEVERRDAVVAQARVALDDHVRAAADRVAAGAAVRDVLADQAYRQRLEVAIEVADAAVVEAVSVAREKDAAETLAREALATARAETKAVESHRDRWDAERRRNRDRKAEDAADDIAQSRYHRDD